MKDKKAERELEEVKRDLQKKINDTKNDVENMGVEYKREKEEVDKRWQEILQWERDEAEKRRVAAEQQAQTDRDNQKRRYDSLMNQMNIDRDNVRTERDKAEKRRVAAEQQAQADRDNQQRLYNGLMSQIEISRAYVNRMRTEGDAAEQELHVFNSFIAFGPVS